jgi:quinol monooxygenase YgiN
VPQIAIIVEYELHEGREAEFTSLIKDHARRTLFEEDGCLRFEVLKPVDTDGRPIPNRMMVSELYADQTALDLHRDNPRMAILRGAMGPLLKSRELTLAEIVDEPEEEGLTPAELNASNDG